MGLTLRLRFLAAAPLLCALALPCSAAESLMEMRLWQERYFFDGLLQARARAARVSADPALLKVVEMVAHQAAQQTANLQQIQGYAKAQIDNLRYAFSQQDPGPSLAVIQNNLNTLAAGAEQVRNNLFYLTARVRMGASQALPDPKLTEMSMLLISQVQNIQLALNALYTDSVAVNAAISAETWGVEDFFRYSSDHMLRSVVQVQDSVFTVYNASYELYSLSKQQ